MASLNMFLPSTHAVMTIRQNKSVVCQATAKGPGGSEEKSILDWVLGGMQKEDQLLETDPILNKVDGPTTSTTTRKGTGSVSVSTPPKKKNGGFGLGGLFAK